MTNRYVDKTIFLSAVQKYCRNPSVLDRLPDQVCLCIDSRIFLKNSVFIAMRGEFNDGHHYINDVINQGVALIIAEDGHEKRSSWQSTCPIVYVKDPLQLYSDIARRHLLRMPATKIAITGSNGKTTTKEMLKALMVKIYGEAKVYASRGNKNNHFGVPLCALEVKPEHVIAIFEMGMNHEGEIASLCEIVLPSIGLITNISYAHGGNFSDGIIGVKRAKGELWQSIAKNGGLAVINRDDPLVVDEAEKHGIHNKITFGSQNEADIKITGLTPFSRSLSSQTVVVRLKDQADFLLAVPLVGEHHAKNAVAALAVVMALRLPVKDLGLALMDMEKTAGRMSMQINHEGHLVINDGYNANPESMKAGIKTCMEIEAKRRIAVIGAMGELGTSSDEHHFSLGKLLAKHFAKLFICGKAARAIVEGAKSVGMAEESIVYQDQSSDLIEPIKTYVEKGDLIFIKGSLSANMKVIADSLNAL